MLLRDRDLHKYCGDFRCPACGTHYDPTNGPCPQCSRKYNLATIAFAAILLLFLLFWLPLEAGSAKAQEVPPETPQLSSNHFRVYDARVWAGAKLLDTPEEQDIFALWGMDYVLPPQRSDYYDPKFGASPVVEIEPVPVQAGLFG